MQAHTFMTDSSEALSKGLPLKVVISLGIVTCCLRLGMTNLKWVGVAAKLREWVRFGGVLIKAGAGLQLRSEFEGLARNSRDTHCIQLGILSLQREGGSYERLVNIYNTQLNHRT
jgi:hypothetical protein